MEDALGLAGDDEALYAVGMRQAEDGLFLWSVDREGQERWWTTWGGAGDESARAVTVDPEDGSVLVAANAGEDVALLRFDPDSGELTDERDWGGEKDDVAHDLVVDRGVVWMVGQTRSWGAGGEDGYVLRFPREASTLPGG